MGLQMRCSRCAELPLMREASTWVVPLQLSAELGHSCASAGVLRVGSGQGKGNKLCLLLPGFK